MGIAILPTEQAGHACLHDIIGKVGCGFNSIFDKSYNLFNNRAGLNIV
jgi:hypothetical protein